jgi:hypothetical protein
VRTQPLGPVWAVPLDGGAGHLLVALQQQRHHQCVSRLLKALHDFDKYRLTKMPQRQYMQVKV